MTGTNNSKTLICGGGLVGSLLAIQLARRGHDVTIYERLPDMRTTSGIGGRSINLVVAARGLRALDRLDLKGRVQNLTVPVYGRMMHAKDGQLTYQPYGRDKSECNYSISRSGLNAFLLTEAERAGASVTFERRAVSVDFDSGRVDFAHEGGATAGATESVDAALIFGADGANSVIRAAMQGRLGFADSMDLLEFGYKELLIPAGADGDYLIERNALHIWPRGRLMLMALPNLGGSFTVTLYMPNEGNASFATLEDGASVLALFEREFPDALPLLGDLETSYFENPTGVLGTVRCAPWFVNGRAALIGDAAHAVVPFFGQGMNCGFEDCRVLDELIEAQSGGDWESLFKEYSATRKPDADAIADMALDNFVEMRDRVADESFLLTKAVEHRLEEAMPRTYRSRYSMVMYGSDIPYRVAKEAGERQRKILEQLCSGLGNADEFDMESAARLIETELTPFLDAHGVTLDY